MGEARLAAHAVGFGRGAHTILEGVDFSFGPGELVSLLGGNGAGKTTLLRILLGLLAPLRGEATLGGAPVRRMNRRAFAEQVAYVPQAHIAPFPYRAREIVALGRAPAVGLFGRMGARDAQAAEEALAMLRIGHLAERDYTTLSGGERQLVMVARALAQGARLLVMDEPMAGLDYGHQLRLLGHLRRLAGQGWGVLMTTHHPDQARLASTRIATLVAGRIDSDGAPDAVLTPETLRRLYGLEPGDIPA
ncbi:iron complex transport system ATP-binding protein [Rhodoblastus acidophilus]|uniref:ABC transporter ATP-binding protein n=1 Tax=Rhodoblastus acidophilus TaxID=1074 RepID=UPI002225A9DA|nr:ABC transporter ATP-binding protein [Rhodoblastus acidophilus]MCW2315615.1 iron complex transport system ATP-binding protein [Rhodoblastus acidophilus]